VLILGLSASFGVGQAAGAPNGGTITGTVKLGTPTERGPAPRRGSGFTDRISNPLKPPKAFDPTPEIVVVLQGGVADPEDTTAGAAVKYRMIGETFEFPVLPVLTGTSVDVHNDSRFERTFFSADDETAFDSPVAPKKKRSLKKFGPAGKVLEISVKDSPHITGTVVAFEHAYFSRVDDSGKFEIENVPQGPWKIKVWYRGGWVKMDDVTVDVVANKPVAATVTLPAKLTTTAAAPTGADKKQPEEKNVETEDD
jgi:hypothetical protein